MRVHDEIIGYCDDCGSPIHAGEEYIEVEEQMICQDCIYDYTYAEWLDLLRLKWKTSHIPHSEMLKEACEDDNRF